MRTRFLLAAVLSVVLPASAEDSISVAMKNVDEKGVGQSLGTIVISTSKFGLVFTPKLHDLPPGLHGFHVHEKPSCDPKEKDGKMAAAEAAGPHYDPAKTGRHAAPWEDGHLGDLPAMHVDAKGAATYPVLAPRLKLAELRGHALMVHAGGDNHADHPAELGGGGHRIACGVIGS
jgi:Cu-Zn family superoxide dismutase